MTLSDEERAQASLETLLLVAAAVFVAAVVGYFLKMAFMTRVAPLANKTA
jgi:uncharacterized protein (UPF0333 family)